MPSSDRPLATVRLWLLLTTAFFLTAAAGGVFSSRFISARFLLDARQEALGLTRLLAVGVQAAGTNATVVARDAERFPGVRRAHILTLAKGKLDGLEITDEGLASEAANRGVAMVSNEPIVKDGQSVFIAYAPIRQPSGAIPSLLAMELSASRYHDANRQLAIGAVIGGGLVALLAAFFAAGIARSMVKGRGGRRIVETLKDHRHTQTFIFEMILATLAISVLAAGVAGLNSLSNTRAETRRLETQIFNYAMLPAPTTADRIGASEKRLLLEQLREREEGNFHVVGAAFTLCAILTLGAFVLLRSSASREHDLTQARQHAARTAAAHAQVAENLPIGFYTFGDDGIRYCNAAWQRLVEQDENEPPARAFDRALHPDDREDVVAALRDAVHNCSGFGFGHRLVTRTGDVRYLETRGVPILDEQGQLEHVVGFSIDVSSRVRARHLLEAKTSEVEATNDRLRQALSDLEENFEAMVHTLVKAVEAKDPYTAGHSARVMQYSVRIGSALGLSPHELRVLRMGALIHDIGKIGVPDAILTKPERLTEEEMEVVRRHSRTGAQMVEGIPMFRECVPVVLLHHERMDGSGYPLGLTSADLPLSVRIVAVADSFDAMTSGRAYRRGFDPQYALDELRKASEKGTLDARIVDCLVSIVMKDGLLNAEDELSAA